MRRLIAHHHVTTSSGVCECRLTRGLDNRCVRGATRKLAGSRFYYWGVRQYKRSSLGKRAVYVLPHNYAQEGSCCMLAWGVGRQRVVVCCGCCRYEVESTRSAVGSFWAPHVVRARSTLPVWCALRLHHQWGKLWIRRDHGHVPGALLLLLSPQVRPQGLELPIGRARDDREEVRVGVPLDHERDRICGVKI